MYGALLGILAELKGKHKTVDKAISALPKKPSNRIEPPVDELIRLKDLMVSYLGEDQEIVAAPIVMAALLSNLKVSYELSDSVQALQQNLEQARSTQDFEVLAKNVAGLVLSTVPSESDSAPNESSIADIKQAILFQLETLKESDAELAKSIDISGLMKSLSQVSNLRDLEFFYKQVFEGLGQRISKKDEFIVELSGLIETVVHQLTDLSLDLKQEGLNNAEAKKDRWRLTELMGG